MNIYKYFLISLLLMVPISQKASGLPSSSNITSLEESDDSALAAIDGQVYVRESYGAIPRQQPVFMTTYEFEFNPIIPVATLINDQSRRALSEYKTLLEYQRLYERLSKISKENCHLLKKLEEQVATSTSQLLELKKIIQTKDVRIMISGIELSRLISMVMYDNYKNSFYQSIEKYLNQEKNSINYFETLDQSQKKAAIEKVKHFLYEADIFHEGALHKIDRGAEKIDEVMKYLQENSEGSFCSIL